MTWSRVARVLAIAAAGGAALVLLLVGLLETPWGVRTVAVTALRIVDPWPGTTARVGGASGGFLTGLELHDVALMHRDGVARVRADTLRLVYRLNEVLSRPLVLREVRAAGLSIVARDLPPPGPKKKNSSPFEVRIGRVDVTRGALLLPLPVLPRDSALEFREVDLRARAIRFGRLETFVVDTLHALGSWPGDSVAGPTPLRVRIDARGALEPARVNVASLALETPASRLVVRGVAPLPRDGAPWTDGYDLRLDAEPVGGGDVGRVVPPLRPMSDLALTASARGDSSALKVKLTARARAGGSADLDGRITAPRRGAVGLAVRGRVKRFDLADLLGGTRGVHVLDVSLDADVAGSSSRELSGPVALALADSGAGAPAAARASLDARFDRGSATVKLDARRAATSLAARGTVIPFERVPSAELTGSLTVPPLRLGAAGDSAARMFYHGGADWTLTARGLSPDSSQGRLHVALTPGPGEPAVLEHGEADFEWRSQRVSARAELAAAHGTVGFRGEVTLGKLPEYRIAELRLTGLDPAVLLGDSTHGRVDAELELAGRGLDPATMTLDGRIAWLAVHRGGHAIDSTHVTFGIARGVASLEARAAIDDGRIVAHATLAPLGGRPQRLEVRLTPARLDVGRLAGGPAGERVLDGTLRFEATAEDLIAAARDLGRLRAAPGDSSAAVAAEDARRTLTALHATLDVSLAPSRLRLTTVRHGALHAEVAGGGIRFRGDLATAAGGVAWEGHARPFDAAPRLDLERLELDALDLGPLLGQREFSTKLVGRITGTITRTTASSLEAGARVDLDHSRINQLTFERLGGAWKWGKGELSGDLEARSRDGHAGLTLHATPLEDSLQISGQGELDFPRLGALVSRDSLEGDAVARISLAGVWPSSGNLRHAEFTAGLEGRAHLDRARIDTVRVAARLDDAVLDVSALDLESNVLALSGAGPIALRGAPVDRASDFRLDGRLFDLSPLARVVREPFLSGGAGHFATSLSGSASRTRGRLELVSNQARAGGFYVDSLAVTSDVELKEHALASGRGHVFAGSFISPMLAARDIDASFTLDSTSVFVDATTAVGDFPGIAVAVRTWPAARKARLERFEVRRFSPVLRLAAPVDIAWGHGFALSELLMKQGDARRLVASGSMDSAGVMQAAAQIDSLALEPFTEMAGYPRYGGHVTGRFDVSGTRLKPSLDGSLRLVLNVDRKPLVAVIDTVRWAGRVLETRTHFAVTKGGALDLEARVPLEATDSSGVTRVQLGRGALHGRLAAHHLDFAALQPIASSRDVRGLRGVLDGEVKLAGTRDAPEWSGALALDRAVLDLPGLGTKFHEGALRLAGGGRDLRLERAGVRSGPGRIDVTGRVSFPDLLRPEMDLAVKLKRFQLMDNLTAKIEMSGELALTGTAAAPAATGKLELANTTTWLEAAATGRTYEPVQLTDQDLHELRTRFEQGGEARAPAPDALSPVRLDVTVRIGHGVWLRRRSDPVLALELNGDVRVHKEPAEPLRIAGTVGVIAGRSYISFLGNRFDVTSASVGLPGKVEDASAQVEAQYDPGSSRQSDAADVQVSAFVSVSSSGTTIDLRSQPYLSRDAIMTFIATGQLPGQVGGQSSSGTASQLAFGYVLGAVGSAAGQRVGFDVVQVSQEAYGGNVLSAGTYVNPKLYLGFRQPVGQQQSTARGPGNEIQSTEYDVEFEAMRRMLVNVQGNDTQTRIFMRPRLGGR